MFWIILLVVVVLIAIAIIENFGIWVFLGVMAVIIAIVVILVKKHLRKKAEQAAKEKAEEEIRKAEEEIRKKELERQRKEEEEKWQEDIRTGKVDFNKAKAHYDLGCLALTSETYDGAIVQFTEAIKFNPRYSEAYCNRGIAYKKTGNIDKAIADYYSALSLNNDDEETRFNLGLAYMDKKDFFAANATFSGLKFFALSKEGRVLAYVNRGISRYNIAKSESDLCQGVGDWIRALDEDVNNLEIRRMIIKANNDGGPVLKAFVRQMLEDRNLSL